MRIPLIVLLLFALFCGPVFTEPLGLKEAIQKGLIYIEASGEGGHSGKSLRLRIQNLEKKKWTLDIPAGLQFQSQDSSYQDLIVVKSRQIEIDKKQIRFVKLYGMCTQASYRSPAKRAKFNLGEVAQGNLAKVVQYLDQNKFLDYSAQNAIWAITDGKRLENIDNPKLAKFVADLLGKPLPSYFIQHIPQNMPGAPAFVEAPTVIKGIFKYQTDTDIEATFGLFDKEGKLLHAFFEGQAQKKGNHKFKFFFEVRRLKKGTYFARLVDRSGKTLKELKVVL